MTKHTDHTATARKIETTSNQLTRLSAADIARRTERQRPPIARTAAAGRDAQPDGTVPRAQPQPQPQEAIVAEPGTDESATLATSLGAGVASAADRHEW